MKILNPIFVTIFFCGSIAAFSQQRPLLIVRKCADFELTGKGDNNEWAKTPWTVLNKLDSGSEQYETKFKTLYSAKGIYVLFNGIDDKITTEFDKDFEDLFRGDVFEVFFHTTPDIPIYFEYEINHLNKELVLLMPHFDEIYYGWTPWHYEGERRIKKMVTVVGGKNKINASIKSWSAELFFPYAFFNPENNTAPSPGTKWNANFYRLDYDTGNMIKWAWSPVESSFHEFK
ncbi:MAG: carbohydrate-binding family 9-like protein, partial [Panacibacter sp.]